MASNTASRRYGEALERLRHSNHADYRAIYARVETWKNRANNWRDLAAQLEARIAELEAGNQDTHPGGSGVKIKPDPSPPDSAW